MTNPRITRVQNLRRSNAAGLHGLGGRRPAPDLMQALKDSLDEVRRDHVHLDVQEPGAAHVARYERDYGVRFVCACGETSGYYTSQAAAEDAWAEHANPGPRSLGMTVEA